jgi:hypothetical protein
LPRLEAHQFLEAVFLKFNGSKRSLSFGRVIDRKMKDIWDTEVSLKVRIFIWKMFHDKLQTREHFFLKKEALGWINFRGGLHI